MSEHPYSLFDAAGAVAPLIFTPCPGTKDTSRDDALATLKAAGARVLITVMPDEELAINEVSDLGACSQAQGLRWFQLPVADDSEPGPDFDASWAKVKADLKQLLDAGERIAIHCKGGSGRTGLVAAVLLLQQGLPLDEATRQVQALRPNALKHPVHVQWLEKFATQNQRGGGA